MRGRVVGAVVPAVAESKSRQGRRLPEESCGLVRFVDSPRASIRPALGGYRLLAAGGQSHPVPRGSPLARGTD